ncbi:hypothetical protein ACI2K4_00855 [Micromonospora sp. NPDC050397]|uniref:hypothetical protein n=1 Tax=Micromonospora sp. NPDC050397 TaxID=3364279 RepID=UPI00384F3FD7
MSHPTPDSPPTRRLVWAPDAVVSRIERDVQPRISLPRSMTLAATFALVFTWPPTFVVFAATTLVAPSATDGASIGRTALWALQLAILIAVVAALPAVWQRAGKPEAAAPDDVSIRGTMLRVAVNALRTGGCASVVLALQGLSVDRIALLAVVLAVVLHLLPVLVARLVRGLRGAPRAGDAERSG